MRAYARAPRKGNYSTFSTLEKQNGQGKEACWGIIKLTVLLRSTAECLYKELSWHDVDSNALFAIAVSLEETTKAVPLEFNGMTLFLLRYRRHDFTKLSRNDL